MSYLSALSCSFPKNKVHQEEIKQIGEKIFSKKINFEKIKSVYDNSGVKTRYLVEDLSWYLREHNWSERNLLFKKEAALLLKKCISETFEKTHLNPENIGAIIVINTTGVSTPTLDAEILNFFNFRSDIIRLPIFGYGCAGGVLGLNRAVEIFKNIRKPVLVCNVELCSLTFRPQIFTKENIVSTALFGDGAASYIVGEKSNCNVMKSMEYTWKNSLNLMGWNIENDGLSVVFDKTIPDFIIKYLPKLVKKFCTTNTDGYVLHSGGMKIIKAYKKIFNNNKTIEFSEKILSKFGNISSVSVLLVLKEILKGKNDGIFLMAALGPGFTAGLSAIKIR